MTWLMSRHRLRIQNLQLHNFVKNDQKRHSFVEGFSSIKLTWIWKKNLSLNVMYICCNYFYYVEFKRLQVHNFKKNGQNASKYCRASFLHRTYKNMTKPGGGAFWSQVVFNGSIILDKLVHCWTASKTRPLLHLAQQNSMSPDLLTYLNWFTSLDCTSPPK